MTTETDTPHGDACDAPDYPSWCDDCRDAYDKRMAAHAQRSTLTCSCTTNPTCPNHGDADPEPTRKEQRDALFAHDPVATTLRAHAWVQDRNACSCGLRATCEPPYYFTGGAGDWHALHVANQFTALGLETVGDWRWVRVRVTGATPEDVESPRRGESPLRAAIAEFRNEAARWEQDGWAVDAIADWFERYADERGN